MKTKYIQYASGIFAALLLSLTSCDYVEKPLQDTGAVDVDSFPEFPENPNTQRHVLLEDFTGHVCPPCPGAGKVARDLITHYAGLGKEFVVVSVHTFDLAEPHPWGSPSFTTDFRTDDGDYYAYDLFTPAINYTPLGFVNRTPYTSSIWVDKADWQPAADLCFAKPLEVNMQMIVEYDSTSKEGLVFVQSEFMATASDDYYLVVYLTQDSIVDWQTNGASTVGDPAYPFNTDVQNYVHRHVFRGCLTPRLGIPVVTGGATVGQEEIRAVSINLNTFPVRNHAPAFVQKDLSLVAYVYKSSTKEVVQVIEKHLIEE